LPSGSATQGFGRFATFTLGFAVPRFQRWNGFCYGFQRWNGFCCTGLSALEYLILPKEQSC
jgi:hypothetical protein